MSRLTMIKPKISGGGGKPRVKRARIDNGAPRGPGKRMDNTARWRRLRERILERDGYRCQQTGEYLVRGKTAPNAAVIDHIEPHRGDPSLFWDEGNLQAVAKSWHDREKRSQERAGRW